MPTSVPAPRLFPGDPRAGEFTSLRLAALAVIVVGVAARRGNVVHSTSSKLFAIVYGDRRGSHELTFIPRDRRV